MYKREAGSATCVRSKTPQTFHFQNIDITTQPDVAHDLVARSRLGRCQGSGTTGRSTRREAITERTPWSLAQAAGEARKREMGIGGRGAYIYIGLSVSPNICGPSDFRQ